MCSLSKMLAKNHVSVRRGVAGAEEAQREQATVERFNCTLAKGMFGHQYNQEMRFVGTAKVCQRSTVARLPAVVSTLNNKITRMTGKKPSDDIRVKAETQKPSTVAVGLEGLEEKKILSSVVTSLSFW